MPLHPQAKAVLDKMAEMGLPPRHEQTPTFARTNSATPPDPGPEVAKVEDRQVPGPAGGVPVRIYTPNGSGPFPLLVWYHGGGWVVGSLDSVDSTCRRMCVGSGAVVVSVDYRLAPRAQVPSGLRRLLRSHTMGVAERSLPQRRPHSAGCRRRERGRQPSSRRASYGPG